MYKKILLASDGSEHALKAAKQALGLAMNQKDAMIEILYVIDGSKAKTDVLHNWNDAKVDKERISRLYPTTELFATNHINYQVNVLHGEPGPTIVDYANKHKFDVVVIGSRGLNRLQEMVLGSVSHKVVKRVHCPVLVVKD